MSPDRFARIACAVCGTAAEPSKVTTFSVAKSSDDYAKLPSELLTAMYRHLEDMSSFHENDLPPLPAAFSKFDGMALERRGLNLQDETLNMCADCQHWLSEGKQPPFSVSNCFKFGETPEALRGLRWVELRLLQVYRTVIYVLHLTANSRVSADDIKQQYKVIVVCSFFV